MIIIIDGTGEYSDEAYTRSMAAGFCRQIEKRTSGYYHRGPVPDGSDTYKIANDMMNKYLSDGLKPGEDLYLVGHSRGGASVIYIAQQLKLRKIPVRAMFLYDAVDRVIAMGPKEIILSLLTKGPVRTAAILAVRQAGLPDVSTVPENVLFCYHARRDTKDKSISRYFAAGLKAAFDALEQCNNINGFGSIKCNQIKDNLRDLWEQDRKMKYCMRETFMPSEGSIDFGNCATSYQGKSLEEHFLGSHGAIGGAPIIDERAPKLLLDADRAAVASVNAWMTANMIAERLI
jgi:hypothetical protein